MICGEGHQDVPAQPCADSQVWSELDVVHEVGRDRIIAQLGFKGLLTQTAIHLAEQQTGESIPGIVLVGRQQSDQYGRCW